MTTTLEALERRLTDLEKRVAAMQQHSESSVPRDNGIDIPLFRAARAQQAAVSASAEKSLKKMGITIDPTITHEEFKKIRDAKPIPPEEEWASREIVRMREEKSE